LAKVVVVPPAKSSPTPAFVVRSMISEPESPAALNGLPPAPVMAICEVKVSVPIWYLTLMSVLMLDTVPVVKPVVRPDFSTCSFSVAAAVPLGAPDTS
jgi:hypothetical protein